MPLPFPAISLSRLVLDEALLNRAMGLGAEVRRGMAVRKVERSTDGCWRVVTTTGHAIEAGTIFLASGKHELRPFRRIHDGKPYWIGFKLYWHLAEPEARALRETIEVILFDGGYAGLQPVKDTTANLCLVLRKAAFARANKAWPTLLNCLLESSPHLAQRLTGSTPCWDEPLAISSVPFGYLCEDRLSEYGLYRIGDQAAVIPAFAGNGISIALHTAHLAAEMFVRGESSATYHRQIRRELARPVRLADGLSLLAEHGWSRSLAVQACRSFPAAVRIAASRTRLRQALAYNNHPLTAARRSARPSRHSASRL